MGITIDKVVHALASDSDRLVMDKASLASMTAGCYASLWRATGQPGQGAIPTTVASCNNSMVGCFTVTPQTAPVKSFIGYFEYASSLSAMTLEVHDRLVHIGGLVGNVATSQTVTGLNMTSISTDNMANRIGGSDYSDIQWWIEWYTNTGGTACNATVNVTYNDTTTGNLTAIALAATRPVGFMQSLNGYIPSASSGKYIVGINSVTLSVTTGTAGNFGFTATRKRSSVFAPILNASFSANWADLPIGEIPESACLTPIVLTSTTSTGTARGGGKVMHIDTT